MDIVEYGKPITLETARQVIDAAMAEALAHNWAMALAVVDSGAHLVALHRMDHTQHGSVEIAQAKAKTAVNFKRPTKLFEEAVAGGGIGLRLLSTPGLCPLEGGIPLVCEGKVIGAIGVSGARSDQDGVVALAGARVVSR